MKIELEIYRPRVNQLPKSFEGVHFFSDGFWYRGYLDGDRLFFVSTSEGRSVGVFAVEFWYYPINVKTLRSE